MGLLLFDLDGTLVESSLVEGEKKLEPAPGIFSEPVLLPNVLERVSAAASEGDSFAIVTNQAGVAWGFTTPEQVYARIGRAVGLLHGFLGRPLSIHVCFAHPGASIARYKEGHERRKPSPAMLQEAVVAHMAGGATFRDSEILMVGDLDTDREAAEAAGIDYADAGDFFGW